MAETIIQVKDLFQNLPTWFVIFMKGTLPLLQRLCMAPMYTYFQCLESDLSGAVMRMKGRFLPIITMYSFHSLIPSHLPNGQSTWHSPQKVG